MPLPFALDHINLWLLDERRRLDAGRLRLRRRGDARAVGAHFATTLGGAPLARIVATHYHPDHLGNAAWLAARFGCPVTMTHGRIPDRARDRSTSARRTRRPTPARCSARTAWPPSTSAALAARGNRYRARRAGAARRRFERMVAGDDDRARRRTTGASSPATAIRPSTRRCYARGARRAHLRRHAAAADQHQRQRLAGRARRRSARPLPGLARRRSTRCRADTLVLPSHGLPFRGIAAARRAAARAS